MGRASSGCPGGESHLEAIRQAHDFKADCRMFLVGIGEYPFWDRNAHQQLPHLWSRLEQRAVRKEVVHFGVPIVVINVIAVGLQGNGQGV